MKSNARVSSQGLTCSNDGFVEMVQEGTDVLLAGLAIVKELTSAFVPQNFKKAIKYGWNGITGVGNYLGYLFAAAYHFSEEGGFGADICEAFGYGYVVIDELQVLVNFL